MSKQPNESSTTDKKSSSRTAFVLIGDIADTTWRMFVPTITGIVGGNFADEQLGTKPWLFVGGTIAGCIVAGLLVRKQLQNTL